MLKAEEEYVLAARWREHGDGSAAHRLMTSHLRLVAKIAIGYRSYGLPVSDLISEGNIGLMQAIKHFNPEKGIRLSTYAMWWIKAAIQVALGVALTVLDDCERHIFERRRLIDPAVTLDELAIEFRISRERVRQIETRAFHKVQMAAHVACARRQDSLTTHRSRMQFDSQSYAHVAP